MEIERVDGIPVARPKGDIDAANAPIVHEQLAAALGPDADCLIVDLGGTRYLDSAGLDMLLRLAERLTHRRASLVLVIPEDSQLQRLATIVGLPRAVRVHPTLSAAQEACTMRRGLDWPVSVPDGAP